MLEKFKRISNPLTIIAIFAGLAEVTATIALSIVTKELQVQFIWFVMLFPVFLVSLFFITLIFKPHVLYSPGDFVNESNFMDLYNRKQIQDLTSIEQSLAKDEKRIEEILKSRYKDSISYDQINARLARGNIAAQMGLALSESGYKLKSSISPDTIERIKSYGFTTEKTDK